MVVFFVLNGRLFGIEIVSGVGFVDVLFGDVDCCGVFFGVLCWIIVMKWLFLFMIICVILKSLYV